MTRIKYRPFETYPKYILNIPREYKLAILSVTVEKEYQYTYDDSSMIYLTNFLITPNYKNIKSVGEDIANFILQDINKKVGREIIKPLPDTFELSGIDNNSLFWKDLKVGLISIGYQNVPREQKELFDRSLKTLKIKGIH
jgi:hypothetical protein